MGICATLKELLAKSGSPKADPATLEAPPLRLPKISGPVTIEREKWEKLELDCMGMMPLFCGHDPRDKSSSFLHRLFPTNNIDGILFVLRGLTEVKPTASDATTVTLSAQDAAAFIGASNWLETVAQPKIFLMQDEEVFLPMADQRIDKIISFSQAVAEAFAGVKAKYPPTSVPGR